MEVNCKHNWKFTTDNTYIKCLICGEQWNAERLVNYLQSKLEQLQEESQEALSAEVELREAFEREVYEHRVTLESIKILAGGN